MKRISLFIALLSLAACGGGGNNGGGGIPGSELPALTQSQKDRVTALSLETSAVSDVSDSFGPQRSKGEKRNSLIPFSSFPQPLNNKELLEKKSSDLQDEMEQAMNNGDCVVEFYPSQMPSGSSQPPENIEVGFSIESSKWGWNPCPITYKNVNLIHTSGSETNAVVNTNSKVDFVINDTKGVFDTLDVTTFNLNMDSTVNTTASQNSVRLVMTMAGQGKVLSKAHGEVNMGISLGANGQFAASENGQGASGSTHFKSTFTVAFKDFKAVGYADVTMTMKDQSMETKGSYYINGASVSAEEFNSLFMMDTEMSMESSSF